MANDLGIAYTRAGSPAQALTEFGRALALHPGSASALHNRGLALLLLGQRDAAVADFRRSLEKDPCLFDARVNLIRLGEPLPSAGVCRWTAAQQRAISAR
ncbi:MAG: tetratricopeptide repeat protein [Acidobacteria bacterium]|nr:tetratricopeptide repeat protein [Acidobacteriota bacterium]